MFWFCDYFTGGLPISYRLFPGNTYEGKTLVAMVQELQKEYSINNILLVADRAMFNEENLLEMESLGIEYIVAARLKTLPGNLKADILQSEYKAAAVMDELYWVKEFGHKSRRLIVGYSSRRAKRCS